MEPRTARESPVQATRRVEVAGSKMERRAQEPAIAGARAAMTLESAGSTVPDLRPAMAFWALDVMRSSRLVKALTMAVSTAASSVPRLSWAMEDDTAGMRALLSSNEVAHPLFQSVPAALEGRRQH